MKPLLGQVNNIIYKIFKNQNPTLAKIIIKWPEIVGTKFSDKVWPQKITHSRERGKKINILYVETENTAISTEIAFQQDIIIERIAVYLGYKGVHKIRFLIR